MYTLVLTYNSGTFSWLIDVSNKYPAIGTKSYSIIIVDILVSSETVTYINVVLPSLNERINCISIPTFFILLPIALIYLIMIIRNKLKHLSMCILYL